MSKLAEKECVPCKGGTPPLKGSALTALAAELGADWRVVEEHHLEKEYKFKNFRDALAFTNKVGELAERINHHPDIFLAWGQVKLTLWTHSIGGLSESDFVFAAKVEALQLSPQQNAAFGQHLSNNISDSRGNSRFFAGPEAGAPFEERFQLFTGGVV